MDIKRIILDDDKRKPLFEDASKLAFGQSYSDHMFTLEYDEGTGWHSPEIKPYQPLMIDPAAKVLHYGQEIFEGQKAYISSDKRILMFRPEENAKRFRNSLNRMCMPELPIEDFLFYEKELIKVDRRWIPVLRGTSLYVRPTAIATEAGLGVKPAKKYLFFIILSPVGSYYKEGFNPIGLWVSDKYSRAAEGGTGAAKAGGNYAGSLYATKIANSEGYSQVLWLDAKEHKYIEEVGAMNIMFIIDNKLVTPPLHGTILPGITRKSVLEMATDLGIEAEERSITISEITEGIDSGRVTEIFGAGTAAVISPVGKLNYKNREYIINNNKTGKWSQKFFDTLTGIQYGDLEDKYNWVSEIN